MVSIPLYYAIKSKNIDIFNLVLNESKDINFQSKQGESVLHLACNFDQKEMLKILLERMQMEYSRLYK